MTRDVPAIFDGSVFRPLVPVDLAQGTPVTVQVRFSPTPTVGDKDEELCLAWHAYLDRMESLPDNSPNDGLSNRDHDQILYGK
jgi:predicted DNA-binding antitoxin AbrB/MazE fold protein